MNKFYLMSIVALVIVIAAAFFFIKPEDGGNQELSEVLNVYNWEDYFGETTLEDFEREYGVKVNLETYEDEDMMISAVQSNPSRYDIIVVSDGTVADMKKMKLLSPIKMENIPNFRNIDERFKNPYYDPGNGYSVPYLWGTTGIAVNRKYVKEGNTWGILWNPEYRGKMAMLIGRYDTIGSALLYLGYSASSANPDELEEARELLLEQKPLLKGYLETTDIRDQLISEELWAGLQYSGEANYAADENENVEYLIPKEGCIIWTDSLAIPRDAKHKYTAEIFINYILDAEVSAGIANYLWYANCNRAAEEFMDPEILESDAVYPLGEDLEKCEYFGEMSNATAIYNDIWAEIQA